MNNVITAASGPVAVTGASGFIGSHVCKNLVHHGYTVRACVRDKTRPEKMEHLLAMNSCGTDRTPAASSSSTQPPSTTTRGSVSIYEADMKVEGSYDDIFAGCVAVFHVAGNFGTDPRWTQSTTVCGRQPPIDEALGIPPQTTKNRRTTSYDQGVYDSYIVSTRHVLDSILRSQTVKRLVYTSSGAAGSCVVEEEDTHDTTVEQNAYGKGKLDCERLIYSFGEKHDIICCSSCPLIVLGPLLAAPWHDQVYQHRLGEVFAGKYTLDYDWNVADVRDIADTQRRMVESSHIKNGSRYCNGSPSNEEPNSADLVALLRELFPDHQAAQQVIHVPVEEESESFGSDSGEESGSASVSCSSESDHANESSLCWNENHVTTWKRPEDELGMCRHTATETIRDTIITLLELGVVNRHVSTAELKDYYNVSEMDGCYNEMEYIMSQLKIRAD